MEQKPHNQTFKNRLLLFIQRMGLSNHQFERECGLSNGYVRNLKQQMTPDKIALVTKTYPRLNRVWLLTGEGEMMLPQEGKVTQTASGSDIVQTVGSGPDALVKAIDEIGQMRVALTDALHVNQQNTSRLFDLLDRVTDRLSSPPSQNCP